MIAPRAAALVVPLLMGRCGVPALPPVEDSPPADTTAAAAAAAALGTLEGPWEPGPGCFQRHLREAISLNERRADVYARWTDGRSRPISRRLIRAERASLVAGWYVDRRAAPFQGAGIPIGCAEFVSMSVTPLLVRAPEKKPRGRFQPGPAPDTLISVITGAYASGGFPEVVVTVDTLIDAMHDAPSYHCMVSHLLESAWRVAVLAPAHSAAAEAAGLPATAPLSELLLRLHMAALPSAARLDREAAPLQEEGVPIICSDVPPLRPAPDTDRIRSPG